MHIEVNGSHLWFDVEGAGALPAGAEMVGRPSLVLVHGGPGSYDHSYFKPHFSALVDVAQVVYLDLRGHGRSGWGDAREWSFEACADDLRVFCDGLGMERPFMFGHSMGGVVAAMYGARHPDHASGLVLASTFARFDLERLVAGVAKRSDPETAELARKDYSGDPVTEAEWARVFATFGPNVPSPEELARRKRNPALGEVGMELMRQLDILDQLGRIDVPTLILVGEEDVISPVEASQEILDEMAPGVGSLEVVPGAGHFPWLDAADLYWTAVRNFVTAIPWPR